MGAGRAGRAGRGARLSFVSACFVVLANACGGASQNPAGGDGGIPGDLACLGTLDGNCCPASGPAPVCIGRFSEAAECAVWPATTTVTVYASPCAGLMAIRTKRAADTYASFYVYDASGALYAIADDATSTSAIECGAGPASFAVSMACTEEWLGESGATGTACTAGAASASSVCH